MPIVIEAKTLGEVADKLANYLYGKNLSLCLGQAQTISKQGRNDYLIKVKRAVWTDEKNSKIVSHINNMVVHIRQQPNSKATIQVK